MKLYSLFIILFSFSSIISYSQKDFDEMIEAEMKSAMHQFSSTEKSINTEFTDNYDLKYHRLNWTIDPSINYIEGAITSYFVALNDLNQIYFDLANGFTIDSVIFQGNTQINLIENNLF